MTTTTTTLTAESRWYGNERQYIARLTGRDSKFTYQRKFIGRKSGSSTSATVDTPGIYEICNIDKKGNKESYFRLIAETPDGGLASLKAHGDNLDGGDADSVVMGLLKRMDAGEEFASMISLERRADSTWAYRVMSKSAAARADRAASIDQAVDACWQILQAFPEREAKKVLAALKLRVSPKPAEIEAPEPEPSVETPIDTQTA